MSKRPTVRTTLNEDFEELGLPMDMGDSARMVGIDVLGQETVTHAPGEAPEVEEAKDAEKKKGEKCDDDDDDDEKNAFGARKGPKDGSGPNSKCSKKEDVEEDDALDGEYVTAELFARIRALPFESMSEEDHAELLAKLEEKKLPDGDEAMLADAEALVKEIQEGAAASRLRRFKGGKTSRKMSFQCPAGRRAESGGGSGRPRCVPSHRAAGGMGALKKETRRKKRWGRSGRGTMSGMRSGRVEKRRTHLRKNEGLMSPLALELSAVTEGIDNSAAMGVRDELIERVISILEFLNEEFADQSVTAIYNDVVETIIDTYEAGRLDEDVMNEDEFIAELDGALTLITKSIAKLEDSEELGNE